MEDLKLLSKFANDGSEDAFRQIVDRYLNLVYSAVNRLCGGDSEMAQDVAQLVFLDLAKKAPELCARPDSGEKQEPFVLSGWLHRAAHFRALEALRAERRRSAREQIAADMNDASDTTSPQLWREIRPSLDNALAKLDRIDRALGPRDGVRSAADFRVCGALERHNAYVAPSVASSAVCPWPPSPTVENAVGSRGVMES